MNALTVLVCVQHLSAFTWILGKGKGKKQLDCGGVVTTVLAACARLAAVHGHKDLSNARFQVPCNLMHYLRRHVIPSLSCLLANYATTIISLWNQLLSTSF